MRKSDGVEFALKVVRKKGMDDYNLKALESEVNIMKILEHDNIVKLHELYDTVSLSFIRSVLSLFFVCCFFVEPNQ